VPLINKGAVSAESVIISTAVFAPGGIMAYPEVPGPVTSRAADSTRYPRLREETIPKPHVGRGTSNPLAVVLMNVHLENCKLFHAARLLVPGKSTQRYNLHRFT